MSKRRKLRLTPTQAICVCDKRITTTPLTVSVFCGKCNKFFDIKDGVKATKKEVMA